ncbi:MAG: ABC transporter permease [Actinobacteria bacterium]|nr:ABC transporter permease [Actinomycetota bacterium]MBW3649649.1 ABC transporter permease [Actinomycetota bacterium]
MTAYALRRLLALVPTWLGISLFAFALSTLSPGDPAELILGRQLDDPPTPQQIEAFREEVGLDDPFIVQYGRFVAGAARGDLGTSFRSGEPVFAELASRFPATLAIAVPAFVVAFALALLVGVISAVRRNSLIDHASRIAALLGDSVPSFVLAYMLIIVFAVNLGMLPVAGRGGPEHFVLPVLTLALATTATLMRLTRSSLLEVLGEDYVRTARAMGLKERTVVLRFALKNALVAVVTVAGLLFAGFVTGTVIVETVFAWPGIGRFVVDSIFDRDYAVIRGFVVFTGTVFVLVNLAVDLLYVRLDPRVRLMSERSTGGR